MAAPPITLDKDVQYGAPLYRCMNDDDAHKTKYLVAYRDVTIIPFGASSQGVPTSPVENTVALYLAEGPQAKQNIEIYAENVYLYLGSSFNFPGKNVTLHCRKLQLVPNGAATKATLDCAGVAGKDNFDPHSDGPNGGQISYEYEAARFTRYSGFSNWGGPRGPDSLQIDFPGQWRPQGDHPSDGHDGANGSEGQPGTNGGSIVLITGSFDQPKSTLQRSDQEKAVTLVMSVEGGRGAAGQPGTNGGNQGGVKYNQEDCTKWQMEKDQTRPRNSLDVSGGPFCELPFEIVNSLAKYALATRRPTAGKGGSGGKAGSNGSRGTVVTNNEILDKMSDDYVLLEAIDAALKSKTMNGGKGGSRGASFDNDPNNTGQKGDDGHDGASVDYSDISYNPKTGIEAGRKVLRDEIAFADPLHIMMLIQRMLFEYQMLFDSRVEKDVPRKVTTAYLDTVRWIQRVMDGKLGDEASRFNTSDQRLVSQCKSMYRQLLHRNISAVDIYGNAFNYVPTAAVKLSLIHGKVEQLKIAEETLQAIADALTNANTEKGQLIANFQKMQSQIVDDDKALRDTETTLNELSQTIDKTLLDLQKQRQKINSDLKDVWDAAKDELKPKCDGWSAVLSALSSVFMFVPHGQPGVTNPGGIMGSGIPATYAIGSAISVGTQVGSMIKDADDSKLREDLIEKWIFDIEDSVDDTALPEAIANANSEVLALRKSDNKLLSRIAVAKNKFQSMCDNYFIGTKIKKVKGVRNEFDAYMDIAESFNNAITSYNQAVIKYQKIRLDQLTAQDGKDLLQSLGDQIQTSQHDILLTYFQQVATFQRTTALQTLYEGIRAYNCASLSYSTAFQRLAPLGSFANIDSVTLGAVANTYFQEEVKRFSESAASLDHFQDRIIKIPATEHKAGFDLFKKSGIFTFDFDIGTSTKYFDKSWYDIRLNDFRLILVGAVAKKLPHSDNAIDVNVQLGSSFYYLEKPIATKDAAARMHEFIYDSVSTTISYKCKNASSSDFKSYTFTSRQENNLKQFDFNPALDSSDSSRYFMPLVSPFTKWRFQVDITKVDLSKLKEIHLSLEGRMRTQRIAVAMAAVHDVSETSAQMDGTQHITVAGPTARNTSQAPVEAPGEILVQVVPRPVRPVVLVNLRALRNLQFVRASIQPSTSTSLLSMSDPARFVTGSSGRAMANFLGKRAPAADVFANSLGPTRSAAAMSLAKGRIEPRQMNAAIQKLNEAIDKPLLNKYYFSRGVLTKPGHVYHARTDIQLTESQVAYIKDPRSFFWAFVKAMPSPYIVVLDPSHSNGWREAVDKNAYVNKNWADIRKKMADMIRNDIDPTGCIVRLAKSCYVGVDAVHEVNTGDETRLMLRMITTGDHNVDGTVDWAVGFDKNKRNIVTVSQTGIGEAKWSFADFLNYFIAEGLFELHQKLFPHSIDAMQKGVSLIEHVAEVAPDLFKQIIAYAHLDGNLGEIFTELRRLYGANVAFEKIRDITAKLDKTIDSIKKAASDAPITTDDGGFHSEDMQLSYGSFVFQTDEPPLTAAQQTDLQHRFAKEMKANINPQELKELRTVVQVLADQWVEVIERVREANSLPGTVFETTADVMYSTGFRELAEAHFKKFINYDQMLANIYDQISAETRRHGPAATLYEGMNTKAISQMLTYAGYDAVVRPYHAADGLLEVTTQETVTRRLVSSLDKNENGVVDSIDTYIKNEAAAQQKTQNDLGKDRAALNDPSKTPEEKAKLEQDIADKEVEEAARVETMERGNGLKDLKDNSEERKKQAGEAVDQAENDLLDGKGEHGGGEHGGGGGGHGEGR